METKQLPKPDEIFNGKPCWNIATASHVAGITITTVMLYVTRGRAGNSGIPFFQREPHTRLYFPCKEFTEWCRETFKPAPPTYRQIVEENRALKARNEELEGWHKSDNELIERQAKMIESLTKK